MCFSFKDRIRRPIVGLAVGVFALLGLVCSAGAAVPQEVKMELAVPEVFAGEFATLRVTITAPADHPVRVVRPDLAESRFLHVTLLDRGEVVSESGVRGQPREDKPDDFTTVEPGKRLELTLPITADTPAAGEYTARVQFRPTPDRAAVYESDLKLRVRDLPAADIEFSTPVEAVGDVRPGNSRRSIELLVVRTGVSHTLFHRAKTRDGGREAVELTRLWTVDGGSKVRAEAHGVDGQRVAGVIRVTSTAGGKESVRWVGYSVGGEVPAPAAEHPSTKPEK